MNLRHLFTKLDQLKWYDWVLPRRVGDRDIRGYDGCGEDYLALHTKKKGFTKFKDFYGKRRKEKKEDTKNHRASLYSSMCAPENSIVAHNISEDI